MHKKAVQVIVDHYTVATCSVKKTKEKKKEQNLSTGSIQSSTCSVKLYNDKLVYLIMDESTFIYHSHEALFLQVYEKRA